MLRGEPYRDNDPELVAERRACQALLDRFNEVGPQQFPELRRDRAGLRPGHDRR
ncbi:maltose acetyltransferase domain-containing protein [Nocardia wallacei]|uniref:maltose acetyltransferase domain-containing protein n=1 Tax=Nocardia wallacei TaxID=480035 RepID=UPI003CC807B6